MLKVLRLSARNLLRYKRRTLLTGLLITVGVVAVLLFGALAGSFRSLMIDSITDSMLGHFQIHRRGYVSSIENLPLTLNLDAEQTERVEHILRDMDEVKAHSLRVKLGGNLSNFKETTNIRLNGIDPDREDRTCPGLRARIVEGEAADALVKPGHILLPQLLARGLDIDVGETVVLVAANRDGSVNGITVIVQAIIESVTGPGGRDGYLHIDDARDLLRMEEPEISEIVVRLENRRHLNRVAQTLRAELAAQQDGRNRPLYEVHTWDQLSPFSNIARMIDILALAINVVLISIVLISVMNVMIMAVYERVREIGTLSALGTPARRVLGLFLGEGILLGLLGAALGTLFSVAAVFVFNVYPMRFAFGRQVLELEPQISPLHIGVVFMLVLVVSLLATLQPARKASRMNPVDALRHV